MRRGSQQKAPDQAGAFGFFVRREKISSLRRMGHPNDSSRPFDFIDLLMNR